MNIKNSKQQEKYTLESMSLSKEDLEEKPEFNHMNVTFIHQRLTDPFEGMKALEQNDHSDRLPRGGATVCRIWGDGDRTAVYGVSVCSCKDGFSRKIGRLIAFGRAKMLSKFQCHEAPPGRQISDNMRQYTKSFDISTQPDEITSWLKNFDVVDIPKSFITFTKK